MDALSSELALGDPEESFLHSSGNEIMSEERLRRLLRDVWSVSTQAKRLTALAREGKAKLRLQMQEQRQSGSNN